MMEDDVPLRETWEAMEELVRRGLVRNIGVCNMQSAMLRDLLSYATIKPAALQVPPLSPPPPLLSLARSASMVLDLLPGLSNRLHCARNLSPPPSHSLTLSHTRTRNGRWSFTHI
jgi:diketogulonate reductase-like aldo/keto reductase